jgi:serine/threonine protein kinase
MDSLLPGSVFASRYEILQLIGKGGMSSVYKAKDQLTGDVLAIKVLPPAESSDQSLLESFRQEVVIARKLLHPHVVRIYDIGVAEGTRFISMEYLDGRDLALVLHEDGPLTPAEFLPIFRQLWTALDYIHSNQIIHGDIKLRNLVLGCDGTLKVMDFGIAQDLSKTRRTLWAGTPGYIAPELWAGDPPSQLSDIFAAGVVCLELLTGEKPRIDRNAPPTTNLAEQVSSSLAKLLHRCISSSPHDRPQSAASILDEASGIWNGARPKLSPEPISINAEGSVVAAPKGLAEANPKDRHPLWTTGRVLISGATICFIALVLSWRHWPQGQWPVLESTANEIRADPLPSALNSPTGQMVLIPEGDLLIGNDHGRKSQQFGYENESPAHTVHVPSFYMDVTEVTNAAYAKFCTSSSHSCPLNPAWDTHYFDRLQYPVLNISWGDAQAFCSWAGKELPTEVQWERTARGDRGALFPWGNDTISPHANLKGAADGFAFTAPVGSFLEDRSSFGVFDMAGNVPEWTADVYSIYPGNASVLPESERAHKVIRGGGFMTDPEFARTTNRASAFPTIRDGKTLHVGFRCAAPVKVMMQTRETLAGHPSLTLREHERR